MPGGDATALDVATAGVGEGCVDPTIAPFTRTTPLGTEQSKTASMAIGAPVVATGPIRTPKPNRRESMPPPSWSVSHTGR